MDKTYIEHVTENAVRAAASAGVGALSSAGLHLIGDVPWYGVVSTAVLAAIMSILTSLAAGWTTGGGTASFVPSVVAADPDKP